MGGLILGSLPADLLPIAESLPIPVILTDRIGSGRMAKRFYNTEHGVQITFACRVYFMNHFGYNKHIQIKFLPRTHSV